jgi:membrane associated rhomboid family serine protease
MILPLRTNIAPRRTPYVNYALILINILIFLVTSRFPELTNAREQLRPWADTFMLTPQHPYLWQFVTYAFLHGGLWHIVGNMFFLYLFGNNVNDELGNLAYLCFYLGGAVFSAVGHILLNTGSATPILGASGAIAAVTGAYLVLFPKTLITIIYWFFIIDTIDIPALWFIGLKMIILDNVIARSTPHVAYDAHLAGYAFGIVVSILLLGTHLIRATDVDLWTLLRQWNRRRVYNDVVASGYDPYTGRNVKHISSKEIHTPPTAGEQKIMDIRAAISAALENGNLPDAAKRYLELVAIDPQQILPRQQMLDIANQLMVARQWVDSAYAYEKFMTHYSNYEYAEQVELMLGILYSRYLNEQQKAVKYLTAAAGRLTDPGQLKMCKDELARLQQS